MDYILKSLALDNEVRVYIAKTTELANEAIKRHDLWPSAASVLSKTMTVASLMGAMQKTGALTIKINGNGPIGNVIVDANYQGEVRGYVDHPHVHFSRKNNLDDITTLGIDGYIDVIKDLGLKDLFTSTIPIQTGDLAQDFTYYFAASEQTPAMVALGIVINEDNTAELCGGIIIQLMPKASESTIKYLESKIDILKSFSTLLFKHQNLEEIFKLLFDNNYQIIDKQDVVFKCHCSKEKFAGGISSLGESEIRSIIDEDGKAEIVCHFCNNVYQFNIDELNNILGEVKK